MTDEGKNGESKDGGAGSSPNRRRSRGRRRSRSRNGAPDKAGKRARDASIPTDDRQPEPQVDSKREIESDLAPEPESGSWREIEPGRDGRSGDGDESAPEPESGSWREIEPGRDGRPGDESAPEPVEEPEPGAREEPGREIEPEPGRDGRPKSGPRAEREVEQERRRPARSITKRKIMIDAGIVVVGLLAIWGVFTVAYGTYNPFYVVASGSMVPELEVYDLLIISAKEEFSTVEPGDIIVFNRPSDHAKVIVHRIVSVIDEDPYTLRAKGDANPASMPGTDFPITEEEYLGKVVHVIPDVGFLPRLIQPPVNYIIIAGIVAYIAVKWFRQKKAEG